MRLRRAVIDALVRHARDQAPLECCGLLIGSPGVVEESYPVQNLRNSRVAFQVDPAGHFTAIRKARDRGLAVVGAYHSHPTSEAVPSETDLREANDPYLLHVIVSLRGAEPVLRGYRITTETAVEVELRIADEASSDSRSAISD